MICVWQKLVCVNLIYILEIDRLEGKWKEPPKYYDVVRDKPVKICVKVSVPAKEHPKVSCNFCG